MDLLITQILVYALIALILIQFIKTVFSKDLTQVFSPMNVVSLCFIYYCLMPYFTGGSVNYSLGRQENVLFHACALISYFCVQWGFSKPTKANFTTWNNLISRNNLVPSAVLLFGVAFACYSACRGVHFSIFAEGERQELNHTSFEHYFLEMVCLYIASFGLLILCLKEKVAKKWIYLLFWYILVSMIFAGTRSRLVLVALLSVTVVYLYPKPRKPNYILLAILAVVMYLGFSIMDKSRTYSQGIRIDAVQNMSRDEIVGGADENASVYWFSSLVLDKFTETNDYVYFEPILTAALMPIPRAIFPWKPDGDYQKKAQRDTIGSDKGGAAYLFFVEGYWAFWWPGLILYSWLLGWICRKYWDNYQRNKNSMGALLAFALYSSLTYSIISRGYLAATFDLYIFTVCMPFWLIQLAGKISPIFRP